MTVHDVVFLLVALMSVWGVHRLWTLVHAARAAPSRPAQLWTCGAGERSAAQLHKVPPVAPARSPYVVTVQVPLYNEPEVAGRVIDAVCSLRHGCVQGLEVQILDDSTDDTTDLVACAVERWRERGIDIVHVRRSGRVGFKAGALGAGLAHARGALVAIFDADFVPPPDFLERMIPRFAAEHGAPDLVQARWGHLNRHASWLTRAQAALLDVHFDVEQRGRAAQGRFFGFNGTAGIWRKSALLRAGGWRAETLTEDLELSVRAWLSGCRFAFADDVEIPAELPGAMAALRLQQRRWARGGVETARLRLPDVWRSPRSTLEKLDLTVKLTQNCVYPLLLLLVLLLPWAALEAETTSGARALPIGAVGLVGGATLLVPLAWCARRRGTPVWRAVAESIAATALAAALSPSCAAAVVGGLLRPGSSRFERTPKEGGAPRRRAHQGHAWATPVCILEASLGVLHLAAAGRLSAHGAVGATPFLWLCGAGLVWAALHDAVAAARSRLSVATSGSVPQQSHDESGHHDDTRPRRFVPGASAREAEDRLVEQG